jgi:hypothetical protein
VGILHAANGRDPPSLPRSVLVFLVGLFALYTYLVRTFDPFHIGLLIGTIVFIVAGVVLAEIGVALSVCLIM